MSWVSSFFKAPASKVRTKNLRTPVMKQAESTLGDIMRAPVPEYPTQEVAPMSEAETIAQGLVKEYAGTEPEGFGTLREAAAGGDLMQRPEIQAVIGRVMESGQQETNRMGRKIQMGGGGSSSTGAGMLGRSVENTQQMILATLLPYLEGAETRRIGAATTLAGLGESSMLNRINALSTTGALPRMLEQLANEAAYTRSMQQINFPYERTAGVAGQILNAQLPMVTTVTGGGPSPFQQFAPAIGSILGAIL